MSCMSWHNRLSCNMQIWFRDKISRKLPNTHDPIKAFGMLE